MSLTYEFHYRRYIRSKKLARCWTTVEMRQVQKCLSSLFTPFCNKWAYLRQDVEDGRTASQ